MHRRRLFALATCALAAAAPLRAQDIERASASQVDLLPACAERGVRRVALMVGPGQSEGELRAMLQQRPLFGEGTEVAFLQPDELRGLRNVADFNRRMHDVLARFLSAGIKIDGTVDVLLEVDEAGTVVNARPNTRNHYVDRVLTDTWKQARFHPYVEQGCRVRAWVHVPQRFSSDWAYTERHVEVTTGPQRPSPR